MHLDEGFCLLAADLLLIQKLIHTLLKHGAEIILPSCFHKTLTLLDDPVCAGIAHKKSFFCFFPFKFQDSLEIVRQLGQKRKIVFDIRGSAEGIF